MYGVAMVIDGFISSVAALVRKSYARNAVIL